MRQWSDFVKECGMNKDFLKENPIIAIYGNFQVGKSTFLNCLLEKYLALAGKGRSTTTLTTRYRYGEKESFKYRQKDGTLSSVTIDNIRKPQFVDLVDLKSGFSVEAWTKSDILSFCDIVDTPGYNANQADTEVAINALKHVNYVLYVTSNRSFSQKDKELLLKLFEQKIPVSILMNCNEGRREERWIPNHEINEVIRKANESWLESEGLSTLPICGKKIYPCNFLFYWSQQGEFDMSKQDIDRPLTVMKHIQGVLDEEGYSYDRESIMNLSGVPQLINQLKIRVQHYDFVTHKWEV